MKFGLALRTSNNHKAQGVRSEEQGVTKNSIKRKNLSVPIPCLHDLRAYFNKLLRLNPPLKKGGRGDLL
jgi:hypothetical protein